MAIPSPFIPESCEKAFRQIGAGEEARAWENASVYGVLPAQVAVSKGETKVMPSGTYDCTEYSCIPTENLNQEMLAEGLYGEFLDERDNQVYKTIQIGEQVWMAQNLNYADSVAMPSLLGGSWCYDNDEENCRKAGRLYTWGATVDSINYLAKPFDPSKC